MALVMCLILAPHPLETICPHLSLSTRGFWPGCGHGALGIEVQYSTETHACRPTGHVPRIAMFSPLVGRRRAYSTVRPIIGWGSARGRRRDGDERVGLQAQALGPDNPSSPHIVVRIPLMRSVNGDSAEDKGTGIGEDVAHAEQLLKSCLQVDAATKVAELAEKHVQLIKHGSSSLTFCLYVCACM